MIALNPMRRSDGVNFEYLHSTTQAFRPASMLDGGLSSFARASVLELRNRQDYIRHDGRPNPMS